MSNTSKDSIAAESNVILAEITLQDYFAGLAMIAILRDPNYTRSFLSDVATSAYFMANEMMRARGESTNSKGGR